MSSVPSGQILLYLLYFAIKAIFIVVMSLIGEWGGSNRVRDNISHMCLAAVTNHMKQKKVGVRGGPGTNSIQICPDSNIQLKVAWAQTPNDHPKVTLWSHRRQMAWRHHRKMDLITVIHRITQSYFARCLSFNC